MSSSTSSSDAPAWRRLAGTLVAVALATVGATAAVAVAVDPYDTGRFALLRVPGVPDQGQRTANASRARDPAFDAAVIGNSHVQLLAPERLNPLTGLSFVSLATPAAMPRDHAVLLRYFARHHPDAKAVVVGTDTFYCGPDVTVPEAKPFPDWLYADSAWDYLRGIVRWELVGTIPERIRYALGREKRARPDGYWDYTELLKRESKGEADLDRPFDFTPVNATGRFPSIDLLRDALRAVPAETAVILLRPPVYVTALPPPGSPGERIQADCLAAMRAVAGERPRTAIVDWRGERAETRDKANFYDHAHYGQAVARLLEIDIAAALAGMGPAPTR